jgi:hypothetical protein
MQFHLLRIRHCRKAAQRRPDSTLVPVDSLSCEPGTTDRKDVPANERLRHAYPGAAMLTLAPRCSSWRLRPAVAALGLLSRTVAARPTCGAQVAADLASSCCLAATVRGVQIRVICSQPSAACAEPGARSHAGYGQVSARLGFAYPGRPCLDGRGRYRRRPPLGRRHGRLPEPYPTTPFGL